MNFRILDLFAGCGALSKGISFNDNFTQVMAVDSDSKLKETFDRNNDCSLTVLNITDNVKEIVKLAEELDVNMITADIPYQRLPVHSARYKTSDRRLSNLNAVMKIIRKTGPEIFVISLPSSFEHAFAGKLLESIMDTEGYRMKSHVVRFAHHGVALDEDKLIVTGSKSRFININNLERSRTTLRAEIGDLNYLSSGKGAFESQYKRISNRERMNTQEKLFNHQAANHSRKTLRQMRDNDFYLRPSWDEVMPSLSKRFDQAVKGGYIHPERNRTLTHREAARIKSFDDNFVFYGSRQTVSGMIADAFPIKVSEEIGRIINTAYSEEKIKREDYVLYLNDCENTAEELMLKGRKAQAVITDPPLSKLEKEDISWLEKYVSLLDDNGSIIIFLTPRYISYVIDELEKLNMDVKDTIYWEVSNPAPQDRRYVLDLKMALWAVRKGSKWTFNIPEGTGYIRPLFETSQIHGDEYNSHPEQKSVMFMEKLVAIHTNPDDLIIDPFMGSGTTAEAAIKNGRKFIGCEIDRKYLEMTKDRISSLTYRLPIE